MFSLEFTRSFKLFSQEILLSFELCFLVFRCSIFKVRSLPALADSLYSISHRSRFVKRFFKTFFEFFILSFLLQALLSACRLFDSLSIISLRAPFVKRFFLTFSSFYSLFLSLYTLSRYRSLKRAFILSLSFPFVNSFLSFFTSFPPTSLFCTLFDTLYSVFCTPLFLRLFRCLLLCFYRYTYSTFFDYHILGLLTLLMIFLSILLVLGENRLLSSKCNLLHPLFGIERVPCEDKWGKRFSPLRRRSKSELHLRLTVFDCFGLKRIIHFHVQPYISTFRNRKGPLRG